MNKFEHFSIRPLNVSRDENTTRVFLLADQRMDLDTYQHGNTNLLLLLFRQDTLVLCSGKVILLCP